MLAAPAFLLVSILFGPKLVEKRQNPVVVPEVWRCGVASGGGLQALCGQVVRARREVIRKPWLFPNSSLP